jgi:hypothetical protein
MTVFPSDFLEATVKLRAIPFFPDDRTIRLEIANQIAKFVGTKEQLDWLVSSAIESIDDWQRNGGIPELRGIFCTRFDPADGKETTAVHATGFREADLIRRHSARVIEENEQKLLAYREETMRLEGKSEPFPLPNVKRLK